MASAQQYAKDTALARRVAEWQDKIQPRLRQEVNTDLFVLNNSVGDLKINVSLLSWHSSYQDLGNDRKLHIFCYVYCQHFA